MANTTRGFGYWAVVVLSALMALFGLPILAGGLWLITLGGSWYYAFAGLGLVVSAYFLFRQSVVGVWVYLLTFVGTLIWALWEAGFNGWAQVPRLVAPTVVLALVLLTIPALRSRFTMPRATFAAAAVGVLALGASMMVLTSVRETSLFAQETTPPMLEAPVAPTQQLDAVPAEPVAPPVQYALQETGVDWPAYGGTQHAARFSPLDQITPENVGNLEKIWEFRTGDLPDGDEAYGNQNTPIKIGNRLFLCSALNKVSALDAATGTEFWTYDPQVSIDAIGYNATCRGLAYYETPGAAQTDMCATRVIMQTLDARLIALDTQTGQLCPDFGNGGIVNLMEGIGDSAPGFYSPTSPPTVVRNIAIVGSQVKDGQTREAPSGVIRGYNAETGALEWAWDMVRPDAPNPLPEGEIYTPGTPNMWTIASGDDELGLVYMPLGNSAVDYWGGDRSPEENEYSTAIVALDVTDGSVRWFYQTVHYDIWDYDLGAQGTLADFPTENGPVAALILPTKQGQFFIFDRATGEPLVEIEERSAPQGGVEPENLSPTQPFVVDFPSQLKPDIEEKNMWGMTPLDQLWCRIQFRQASYEGRYTPPTTDVPWIQYPGYNGGSDWGGVAVDSGRNILVSNYNDTPNYNRLIPREDIDALGIVPIGHPDHATGNSHSGISPQALTPYGIEVNAGWRVPFTGMLCKEPPYGGIMAIDMATKQVLWDKPFGSARKNGPFGIPSMLPFDIGTPNNGGTAITATGLIFVAATTDDLIRAISTETGETLWQAELPAGGQATPIIYEAEGRQIVVINAGGHNFMETPIGDYFIAYALPGVGS
ncbi:membrane-bound PQQ-dependent dehydrogenase, glucose/quinate/shikimate family [Devosia sp. 2618]|uniref:membrane-bound PQQ-dependent dehydrogenase, glucose/quinate/shikimate family n=1 Tax=Devosia sp. 2618 TaxID=3156454 RepID=UPI0033986E3D